MFLSQHALQLPQLLPCSGAGQVLASELVTTDDVHGHAFGDGPSILDPDSLIIKLAGTASGSFRYSRS